MKNLVFLIVLISIIPSCSFISKPLNKLKILDEIKLDIPEPSGITYYKNHLYIASDNNGLVYKTDLKGKITKKIPTDFEDLEGVAINNNGELYVVNESKRSFIKIELTGETKKKYKIKGNQKKHNSGLEGACFYQKNESFYIINESSPKQLLNITKKGKIIEKIDIPFAEDLSGICVDESSDELWLVSDESKKIFQISTKGKLINSYNIAVDKAEGIVINNNKIYVVSDSTNKLFVFEKPL